MSEQAQTQSPENNAADGATGVPFVVGLGASAGGLAAYRTLLETLPNDLPVAYVLVQHLDPNHDSLLGDLLKKNTPMPIAEADDGVKIEAGQIYVIPAGVFIEIDRGHITHVRRHTAPRGGHMAIDTFFKSMAEELRERSIGVVLTGVGTDGTAGVRAIKAQGGLTIAQDPQEAEHTGMPRTAAETGRADLVLPLAKIAEAIRSYVEHPYAAEPIPRETEELGEEEPGNLTDGDLAIEQIVRLVKRRSGVLADNYKHKTVARRVRRRMGLLSIPSEQEYLALLKENEDEAERLGRDLLISVTDFFRDEASYKYLTESVFPELVRKAHKRSVNEDEPRLRLWVAGCATGEEAYSLAMLLSEEIEQQSADVNLQVFASDVDDGALQVARQAVYPPASVAAIPETRRERWMHRLSSGSWKIQRSLRDTVSFARHDLLDDPPFSKIDLVSCRNVLIYLRREAQREALSLFHFGLRPEGILFLGSSESPGPDGGFATVSKRHRVYRKLGESRHVELLTHRTRTIPEHRKPVTAAKDDAPRHRTEPSLADLARKAVLETVAPAAVVLDANSRIIYVTGDVKPYLDFPAGEMNTELIKMLRPAFRTRVRAVIFKARRERISVNAAVIEEHEESGERTETLITVSPRPNVEDDDPLLVVAFRPTNVRLRAGASDEEADENLVGRLEQELAATKDDLRSTIEELETANEELKSSNEEATSMNEELQSSNEELEASSEELRSLNEELNTVNTQLKEKLVELEESNNDLTNLMTSTRLAAVFLDTNFCVRRYTQPATKLLSVIESDIGRPITHLKGQCIDDGLLQDAKEVLEGLMPSEQEMCTDDGRWFLRRVLPYRTENNRIDGVVVAYHDVTGLKQASSALESRERQQAAIARLGLRALTDSDLDGLMEDLCEEVVRVLDADFAKVLEYRPENSDFLLRAGVGWNEGMVGHATVPASNRSQAGFTLEKIEPVLVDELSKERRFKGPALLLDHGVVSGMSCVIPNGDRPFGVLGVHTKTHRDFSADDANFLQSAANLLAVAVHMRRDESLLKTSEARARQDRAEIESIYQGAPVGLAVLDRDLRYVRVNRELAEMNGLSVDAHLGRSVSEVLPDIGPKVEQAFRSVLDSGEPMWNIEVAGIFPADPDTTHTWLENIIPIQGDDGQVTGLHVMAWDITERKAAEERELMLRHELDHRLKNTMMTVVSVADLSAQEATDLTTFRKKFVKRMLAISSVHTLLSKKGWTRATLKDVTTAVLSPYLSDNGEAPRIRIKGSAVSLSTKTGLMLGMMLHELATNAIKHGSLSVKDGYVNVDWASTSDGMVELRWREQDGPETTTPKKRSYGLTLIERAGPYDIGGSAELQFLEHGLTAKIRFPVRDQD